MIDSIILKKQIIFLTFAIVLFLTNCKTMDNGEQEESDAEAYSIPPELPIPERLIELGEKYREEGDNLKALDCFNAAIKINPSYAPAYTYRGLFYIRTKAYTEALKDLGEAVKLTPYPNPRSREDVMAYIFYGLCHYELGNYEQAIPVFTKTVEKNPYYADAYNFRGLAYSKLGQYEQALEEYTLAIHFGKIVKGAQDVYYLNRGCIYGVLKDYKKAIDDFTKSIEFKADSAEVYVERGNAYNFLEKYDKALEDFTHALILKSNLMTAYLGCGMVYFNMGKYEESVAAFTKAEEINPSVYAYGGRGSALIYLLKHEAAVNDFNRALKLKPMDGSLYKMRGVAYLNWGKYQEAIHDFDESVKLNPNDLETRQGREEAYRALHSIMEGYTFILPPSKLHAEMSIQNQRIANPDR
ncbi:tetratricopeptide repeat protein [Treponema sp. OMZ 840]|uniref:tetratricopeptide repeat protein n=1 Tax=Treponema sp. OMZ 840 TaxID=244313 RepID=UPI003D92DACA